MTRCVHIPEKWRLIDVDAREHSERIHSVEISGGFFTIFTKGNVAEFKNLGVPHNAGRFHAEECHTRWIKDEFPDQQISAEWDSHFHVIVDNPTWTDFAPYVHEMHESLANQIRDLLNDGICNGQTETRTAAAVG